MPSRFLQLADAVKAAINAGVTPSPGAIRVYAPSYDTAKTRALYVVVVPGQEREAEASNRDDRSDTVKMYVAVYRKLNSGDGRAEDSNAEADAVIELAEKIYDLFDFRTDLIGFRLIGINHSPVFIPQYLRELGVVASIVAFDFKQL